MVAGEQLLTSRSDAPWLPPGGRADVVLGDVVPDPACVARLLVTRAGRIHAVPRADGTGLDIPTRAAAAGLPACPDQLVLDVLGHPWPTTLLGYVRNVVSAPTRDYRWPSPVAHFLVWRCAAPPGWEPDGNWLGAEDARTELGERHWWPLAETVIGKAADDHHHRGTV